MKTKCNSDINHKLLNYYKVVKDQWILNLKLCAYARLSMIKINIENKQSLC